MTCSSSLTSCLAETVELLLKLSAQDIFYGVFTSILRRRENW